MEGMNGYLYFEDDLNNKKTFIKVIDKEPNLYRISLEKKITNKANYIEQSLTNTPLKKNMNRFNKDKENSGVA
jgi:hypothetical protein